MALIDTRALTARKSQGGKVAKVYQEAMRRVKGQGCLRILDFGCGYGQSYDLLYSVNDRIIWHGHDLHQRVSSDCYFERSDLPSIAQWCDIVLLSNVLNVQESWYDLKETLILAITSVRWGGQLIWNYPKDPRRMPEMTLAKLQEIIKDTMKYRPDIFSVYVR